MVNPILSILGLVAKKVFDKLFDECADEWSSKLKAKLKGDPARNAFKKALGEAIHRYATTDKHLMLARPLLEENGPLTEDSVVEELMQIVRFRREPNAELIGDRWKASIDNSPQWCDFTKEAKLLIRYLKDELRETKVFRQVFVDKSIKSIDTTVVISVKILKSIEDQLTELVKLIDTMEHFFRAPFNIYDKIRDYTWFIDEKTQGFVGRQWVFDKVKCFMDKNPRGYFFIIGDPGIGKSALAAQMIKQNGYVHHFNIQAQGISEASQFLNNVCAQLIANYKLEYEVLPPEASEDAGFLNKVLDEVSTKLDSDEKCVIVVDALDEAYMPHRMSPGENLLYLPLIVPEGVYFIVTMRNVKKIKPHVQCEQREFFIKADSSDNLVDVADFLQASTTRPDIQKYIQAQNIGTEDFVGMMLKKSEGNFMYLRHVLPEIERGAYKDLKLDVLPVGLENYYEDHWRRMRGKGEEAWFRYKLPIIMALTVVKEPVSIDLIVEFSGKERPRIRAVLQEWSQFLHEEQVGYEGGLQKRYCLYHDSFYDFIAGKEEVADERVNLKAAESKIADIIYSKLYDDG